MRFVGLLAATLISVGSSAYAAPAPLPPGLTAANGQPLSASGKSTSGTFIAGTSTNTWLWEPNHKALEAAEGECKAKARELIFNGDRGALGETHYWVYLTDTQFAGFEENLVLKVDREACTAVIEPRRTVARWIIAGNFEYIISVAPSGQAKQHVLTQSDRTDIVLQYPFGRYLGSLPSCEKGETRERERIGGAAAQCCSLYFLASSTECVATGPARIRGYVLRKGNFSDDLQSNVSYVTAIDGNAAIPDVVFSWDTAGFDLPIGR